MLHVAAAVLVTVGAVSLSVNFEVVPPFQSTAPSSQGEFFLAKKPAAQRQTVCVVHLNIPTRVYYILTCVKCSSQNWAFGAMQLVSLTLNSTSISINDSYLAPVT